eukprot:4363369-Amphidinium_carterae.1
MKLPHEAAAPATTRSQHCQNCTLQKVHGMQTCIKCGAKIEGSKPDHSRRNRLCSSCRGEA